MPCIAFRSRLVLPKAFQKNASHPFGFFNAPQLTCASTRRCVALKKPLTFVRGFVSRSRADYKSKSKNINNFILVCYSIYYILQYKIFDEKMTKNVVPNVVPNIFMQNNYKWDTHINL
jgi:hypothetical protein